MSSYILPTSDLMAEVQQRMLLLHSKDISYSDILDSVFKSLQRPSNFPQTFNNAMFESSLDGSDLIISRDYESDVDRLCDAQSNIHDYGIIEDILWLMYTQLYSLLCQIGTYGHTNQYTYDYSELYGNDIVLHIK